MRPARGGAAVQVSDEALVARESTDGVQAAPDEGAAALGSAPEAAKRLLRPTLQTARFAQHAAQSLPSTRPGSNESGTFRHCARHTEEEEELKGWRRRAAAASSG
eukprot:6597778-Prymnesium_polylepis.1